MAMVELLCLILWLPTLYIYHRVGQVAPFRQFQHGPSSTAVTGLLHSICPACTACCSHDTMWQRVWHGANSLAQLTQHQVTLPTAGRARHVPAMICGPGLAIWQPKNHHALSKSTHTQLPNARQPGKLAADMCPDVTLNPHSAPPHACAYEHITQHCWLLSMSVAAAKPFTQFSLGPAMQ